MTWLLVYICSQNSRSFSNNQCFDNFTGSFCQFSMAKAETLNTEKANQIPRLRRDAKELPGDRWPVMLETW